MTFDRSPTPVVMQVDTGCAFTWVAQKRCTIEQYRRRVDSGSEAPSADGSNTGWVLDQSRTSRHGFYVPRPPGSGHERLPFERKYADGTAIRGAWTLGNSPGRDAVACEGSDGTVVQWGQLVSAGTPIVSVSAVGEYISSLAESASEPSGAGTQWLLDFEEGAAQGLVGLAPRLSPNKCAGFGACRRGATNLIASFYMCGVVRHPAWTLDGPAGRMYLGSSAGAEAGARGKQPAARYPTVPPHQYWKLDAFNLRLVYSDGLATVLYPRAVVHVDSGATHIVFPEGAFAGLPRASHLNDNCRADLPGHVSARDVRRAGGAAGGLLPDIVFELGGPGTARGNRTLAGQTVYITASEYGTSTATPPVCRTGLAAILKVPAGASPEIILGAPFFRSHRVGFELSVTPGGTGPGPHHITIERARVVDGEVPGGHRRPAPRDSG